MLEVKDFYSELGENILYLLADFARAVLLLASDPSWNKIRFSTPEIIQPYFHCIE